MNELLLPQTTGPDGGHAAAEFDGSTFGSPTGGTFRVLRAGSQPGLPALLESHRPVDTGLFSDLYAMCRAGDLSRAALTARAYASGRYGRGLQEGVVHTDLDTALDGSIYTTVYEAWNELVWEWMEVLEVIPGISHYETMKLDALSEIIVDDQTGNATASGTLPEVPANHGYDEAAIGEKYETWSIKDYGATFTISDRAMRADAKGALVRIPQMLGRAARRTVSASVANLFEQASGLGPTMTEDSAVAFSTTNSNYAAVDITLAYVEAAFSAFASQTAYGSSRPMNLKPKWLVVPAGLSLTADAIVGPNATKLIAGTNTAAQSDTNVVAGKLRPSVWSCLTDTDAWMLFCDWRDMRHGVVGFLDGQQAPIIEVQGSVSLSDAIGKKYRVRCPHGVGLADFRGVYRSIGAG